MTGTQPHIVRGQFLDVAVTGSERDGFAVQRRMANLCEDGLAPALDGVLSHIVPTDEHWTIDRLDIDAGGFTLETLEHDFIDMVTQAIERRLRELAVAASGGLDRTGSRAPIQRPLRSEDDTTRERPPSGLPDSVTSIQRRTGPQSLAAAFVYFLETGVLPWWFRLPAGQTLEDVVLASWRTEAPPPSFGRPLLEAMASERVRRRLVRQFSAGFLEFLLESLSPEGAVAVRDILAEVERISLAPDILRLVTEELWLTAYASIAAGRRPTAEGIVAGWLAALPASERLSAQPLFEGISKTWPVPEVQDEVASESAAAEDAAAADEASRDASGASIDLEEGVFIDCAGVVLLHPFLPRLFEAVGIAREGKLVQPNRALCLLHFLATGQRRAPEYDLLLPKVLCNLPLEAPVDSPVAPSPAEEEEAVALLEAVIRHWQAIGDTSVDGLRGTFLTRSGKLTRRADGDDVLQVETQSFDILLDQLPWGIAMIQLPWMDKSLSVEWRF